MALGGDESVKLEAIKNGDSVGDAAIALNKAMAKSIQGKRKDFEEAANELEGTDIPEEKAELSDEEMKAKEAQDALNKVYGEKK
jgi:RNase H-fold protein (predicted Holliday junction resolvase)